MNVGVQGKTKALICEQENKYQHYMLVWKTKNGEQKPAAPIPVRVEANRKMILRAPDSNGLPLDDFCREKFIYQLHVVRLQEEISLTRNAICRKAYLKLLDVWSLIALAVKIIWIELLDSL